MSKRTLPPAGVPCEDNAGDAPISVEVFVFAPMSLEVLVGVAPGDTPDFAALRAELLVSARRCPEELPSLPLSTSLMELLTLDAAALSFAINPRRWRTGIACVFCCPCPPLDPAALAQSTPDDILLVVVVKVNGVAESEVCLASRSAGPPTAAMVGYG